MKKISSVTNVCAGYSESDIQFFAIVQNLYMTLNNSLRWSFHSVPVSDSCATDFHGAGISLFFTVSLRETMRETGKW